MFPGVTGLGDVAVDVDAVRPTVAPTAAMAKPAKVRRSRGKEGISVTPGWAVASP
jgi:hypothetical protein